MKRTPMAANRHGIILVYCWKYILEEAMKVLRLDNIKQSQQLSKTELALRECGEGIIHLKHYLLSTRLSTKWCMTKINEAQEIILEDLQCRH